MKHDDETTAPDYESLIDYYKTNSPQQTDSFSNGQRLLRAMFRDADDYVLKPDRSQKTTYTFKGQDSLPPELQNFNPWVFILNPVGEKIAQAIKDESHVSPGKIESISKFQNFRFEWDDNGFGNVVDKITQLNFLKESGLPVSAILDTGNKSIHALLSVDGITSLEEYRLLAVSILARLPGYPDPAAIEPNQPIWLPGGRRSIEKNDEVTFSYPKLLYAGRPISKSELQSWISYTTIKSTELLTNLRDLPGVRDSEYEFEPDSKTDELILTTVKKLGGKIIRPHPLGWTAQCPFHDNRRHPTALVFRSGYVTCKSSNCIGGGWLLPIELRKGKSESFSEFSQSELKEAYEMGLSEEDLRYEKETESYFQSPVELKVLLSGHRKLTGKLGKDKSTAFCLSFESAKASLSAYGRLRSLGQACFYGRGDDEYFVCCIFGSEIELNKFKNFIAGIVSFGLLQSAPTVVPIEKDDQLRDFSVCKLSYAWGLSPTIGDLDAMLGLRPSFWLDHFLPPQAAWPFIPGKHQRLQNLFPGQAKKITSEIRESFANALTPTERHSEPHKFETLRGLDPAEEVRFETLAEAGVAIGLLIEKGANIGKGTSQNFKNLPKFREVIQLQESRKKPVITDSSVLTETDRNQNLLSIIKNQIYQCKTSYFGIVAPAGFGKTTFLQNFLPSNLHELHIKSALVARERVFDVIEGEGKANQWESRLARGGFHRDLPKNEKVKLLQASKPSRKVPIGDAIYDDEGIRFEDDGIELSDDQWSEGVDSTEENLQQVISVTAFAVVGYNQEDLARRLVEIRRVSGGFIC